MTDIQYIRTRVQALQTKIRIKGTCHIWQGKWHHGQPEAKFDGRRQSILPYVYAAYHGAMPADGAACRMTCGEPLCVNPEHMQARARNMTQVRSARSKSHKGDYKQARTHGITEDRIESRQCKITKLQAEAELQ